MQQQLLVAGKKNMVELSGRKRLKVGRPNRCMFCRCDEGWHLFSNSGVKDQLNDCTLSIPQSFENSHAPCSLMLWHD